MFDTVCRIYKHSCGYACLLESSSSDVYQLFIIYTYTICVYETCAIPIHIKYPPRDKCVYVCVCVYTCFLRSPVVRTITRSSSSRECKRRNSSNTTKLLQSHVLIVVPGEQLFKNVSVTLSCHTRSYPSSPFYLFSPLLHSTTFTAKIWQILLARFRSFRKQRYQLKFNPRRCYAAAAFEETLSSKRLRCSTKSFRNSHGHIIYV